MRFLSAKRRHKAARPLLLVMALFLMGVVYAGFAPTGKSNADATMTQQVKEGQALFAVGCSSCHGLQGEGGSQGPSLVGVGAAAVDFQVSTGRMPLSNPGEQAPRKPAVYSSEDTAKLAAYVASLGPGPAIPTEAQYNPSGLTEEQIAKGGELFRTNCSACHNFAGLGGALPDGRYAPELRGVPEKQIYEALRTGPQQMPIFSSQNLTDDDVRAIIGYLKAMEAQPNRGGLNFGGIGPVAEGFWAWVVGIGGLIGFSVWIASKGARAK
ncbi:cytochrome bc1 complex diheme cytochrome c subunit [Enemella evansiae]|uniref:cytochrome bc1 complex diheme cytochrome c subunit n=1 Tax=Enemella evansiae TaxID=2016499 RepID=UPI00105F9C34|nr:c-type cytochrome [Enemella evansiae]TDO93831.1 menaquinol-cytochrome c reductase cytochrome c1 subunit precursor [Enemella evansiae]